MFIEWSPIKRLGSVGAPFVAIQVSKIPQIISMCLPGFVWQKSAFVFRFLVGLSKSQCLGDVRFILL